MQLDIGAYEQNGGVMKKILILGMLSLSLIFTSCAAVSNAVVKSSKTATYSHPWKNYTYDKVFNAALYAMNADDEMITEADRSSGIIRTRYYDRNAQAEANGYYLITPGDKMVFYSSSTYLEVTQKVDPVADYYKITNVPKSATAFDTDSIMAGSKEEAIWIDNTQKFLDNVIATRESAWQAIQEAIVDRISEACKTLGGEKE